MTLALVRRLAPVLVLTAVLAVPGRAADRQTIAAWNVAGTALLTYAGCLVQTKVLKRATGNPLRCLAAGAAGGVGFYQAKRLAGDGHITTAWLVANLSTSVIENTAMGEHPLSRLGYSFGPFRIRVATPADREQASWADLDLSLVETGYLARMLVDADDVDVRDGMLWWETRDPEIDERGRVLHGYAWGMYPGVWTRARRHVWNHEAIHAVQSLQLDSVEPPAFDLDSGDGVRPRRELVRLRYIRAGSINFFDNVTWAQVPYEDRWAEIEAYRLSEDRRPPE